MFQRRNFLEEIETHEAVLKTELTRQHEFEDAIRDLELKLNQAVLRLHSTSNLLSGANLDSSFQEVQAALAERAALEIMCNGGKSKINHTRTQLTEQQNRVNRLSGHIEGLRNEHYRAIGITNSQW